MPIPPDLTDSVYAMIVLTYATFAATNYLFTSAEKRATTAIKKINELKTGDCEFVWKKQEIDGGRRIPEDGARDPLVTILEEFDTVTSGSNAVIKRWGWLHHVLFVSVLLAAFLLLPVLILKEGILPDIMIASVNWATERAVLIEQVIASFSVPLVGINLLRMGGKLKRVENLRDMMNAVSAGGQFLGHSLPAIAKTEVGDEQSTSD